MTCTIEITDEMIRDGSRLSDTQCPIGLALHAAGLEPICVGFNFISCAAEGRVHCLPMPREASNFLRCHDAGQRVSPTKFPLTILEELPRPLPARLLRKPMPKAPPLPARGGVRRLVRLRRRITGLAGLFSF